MELLHPIVKWAGGKTQLLEYLISKCPKKYNRYFEPFVGGGAFLLALQPEDAVINDINADLIAIYKCLCNECDFNLMMEVIDTFVEQHSKENFYKVRELDRDKKFDSLKNYEKAARTIYLNKTCFNGLYRVNSKGFFNVPWNGNKNPNCYDKTNINNVHKYFVNKKIAILSEDFEKCVSSAQSGDFVYFDPPYDSPEGKKSFTTYTKNQFGKDEQIRLAKVFKELSEKGVFVMASNHNTDFIKDLYQDFNIEVVEARRSINSKGNERGTVEEVIITNY